MRGSCPRPDAKAAAGMSLPPRQSDIARPYARVYGPRTSSFTVPAVAFTARVLMVTI